jgi:hypothetical protein
MSISPNLAFASSKAASTRSKSRTSAAMPIASWPSATRAPAAAVMRSRLRLIRAIRAPARASAWAMARLMPPEPPATKATLPASGKPWMSVI